MDNFGSLGRMMVGLTLLSIGQTWFGPPSNQVQVDAQVRHTFFANYTINPLLELIIIYS